MGKAKRFNPYDESVSEKRKTIENYGEGRQKLSGIGSSFRSPPLEPPTATPQPTISNCPAICTEHNLGSVSGGIEIDWRLANFYRAVVTGATTFNLTNTPKTPKRQDICIEVQQDATGGHTVDFIQGFANNFVPKVITGANRYTSWQIYTYQEPSGTDVFHGFQKDGSGVGITVPGGGGSFQGFSGYILAELTADQTTNIGINDHIEFDTIIENDTLIVSPGTGQARGIFSGFRPGHIYSCNVYLGAEGSGATLNFTAQWFDRIGNTIIGSHAEVIAATSTAHRNSQPTGTTFFKSSSVADSLEVRISNATALTSILNGSSTTEPTTFATIKDCGVTESTINEAEPAPEFGEIDVREMMYSQVRTNTSASRFDGRLAISQDFTDVSFVAGTKLVRDIRMKGLMVDVTTKGGAARQFTLVENGTDVGPLHELPASTTGFIDLGTFDVLLDKTKDYGWRTVNGNSGDDWQMTMIVWYL